MPDRPGPHDRHRVPAGVIAHAVWRSHRVARSVRDVEDLRCERGIRATDATVRAWVATFGAPYAAERRTRDARPGRPWHREEVVTRAGGTPVDHWRAVDAHGHVLDVLGQAHRDTAAAARVFRCLLGRLLGRTGGPPEQIVTEARGSEIATVEHRPVRAAARRNNRVEPSYHPTRVREYVMRRFQSLTSAQRFLAACSGFGHHVGVRRHLLTAAEHRSVRHVRYAGWRELAPVAVAACTTGEAPRSDHQLGGATVHLTKPFVPLHHPPSVEARMARVIVFDLNETLLDLSALDHPFQRVFGTADVRTPWFKQVLELFLTATVIDAYRPFAEVTDAALAMVARQREVQLTDDDRNHIRAAMRALPAYPDVRPALEQLKGAGLRVATLTNSGAQAVRDHLEHTGLTTLFDLVLSVDAVGRYKPARAAYEYAAARLEVGLADIRLVAAHSWDVAGAMRAGCAAAFVARPNQVLDSTGPAPEIVGRNLAEVAARIIAVDR